MLTTPIRAAALAGVSALMLSGCLLSPGKFSSELQLMKDGSFSYSYDGQIQMLALSKLSEMGSGAGREFEAEPCLTDDFDPRECTAEELAEQEREWEAEAEERAARNRREAEEMKAFLGGIDPSKPEAAEEVVKLLERQRGWESIEHLGDGLFEVEFAVSGQLAYDFAFPLIESLPLANMFVTVNLRDDNQVRINAPGFAAQGGGNPMQGMMAGFAGLASMGEQSGSSEDELPNLVLPEGRFTVITDGTILANNTDEGPAPHASGQALSWDISPRTEQAPTALVSFD